MTDVAPRFKADVKRAPWSKARKAVMERDVSCQLGPLDCGGRLDVHHRKLRSQGGTDDPDNLVLVCVWHHQHIHGHPAWSYEHDWLRSPHKGESA